MFVINHRDVSWNVLEGDFFLFSARKNRYFKLNQIGRDIWQIICDCPDGIDIKSIASKLQVQYNILDLNAVQIDIENFVNELIEQGVLLVLAAKDGDKL